MRRFGTAEVEQGDTGGSEGEDTNKGDRKTMEFGSSGTMKAAPEGIPSQTGRTQKMFVLPEEVADQILASNLDSVPPEDEGHAPSHEQLIVPPEIAREARQEQTKEETTGTGEEHPADSPQVAEQPINPLPLVKEPEVTPPETSEPDDFLPPPSTFDLRPRHSLQEQQPRSIGGVDSIGTKTRLAIAIAVGAAIGLAGVKYYGEDIVRYIDEIEASQSK